MVLLVLLLLALALVAFAAAVPLGLGPYASAAWEALCLRWVSARRAGRL